MSTINSPVDSLWVTEVDNTYKALRASLMPRDWQLPLHIGNQSKLSCRTGLVTGVAAAGGILSMRWTNAQFNFLLQKLTVTAYLSTVFGAAQELSVDFVRLINYGTADTGGTPVTPLSKGSIKDTSMGVSSIADLRVAAAAALTNGTATVETNPISEEVFPLSTVTLGSSARVELFDMKPGEQVPQVFRAQEGFRVRILQAMGAGGVVVFHFNMEFGEIPNNY